MLRAHSIGSHACVLFSGFTCVCVSPSEYCPACASTHTYSVRVSRFSGVSLSAAMAGSIWLPLFSLGVRAVSLPVS